MKTIWTVLGDLRIAVVLLMAATATLLIGSVYANRNFSLFMELNRARIQDWLPDQLASRPELVWWIPVLLIVSDSGVGVIVAGLTLIMVLMGVYYIARPKETLSFNAPSGPMASGSLVARSTRIINAGIKKMIYVTPDEKGGMVNHVDRLPLFWRDRARRCDCRQAVCSPETERLARDLFDSSARDWGMKKEGTK